MADITRTKAKIGRVNQEGNITFTGKAGVAIEAGQPVYIDSNGVLQLADANGSGTDKFDGLALDSVGAGDSVEVLSEGDVYGFTLTGAYRALVYVSNSVGELADAAGSTSLQVGRIVPHWNAKEATKVLRVTGFAG